MVERTVPEAGRLSPAELPEIARRSRQVLTNMDPQIQWVHSYVTADKMYCLYIAPDAEAIREHARQGGFPADRIARVVGTLDPTNAEAPPGEPASSG
ncbi:MAG: DUF4242 domain-containing protein [Candidatus Bipolaricaulaceae bacterium]